VLAVVITIMVLYFAVAASRLVPDPRMERVLEQNVTEEP
jgi:hypothetical protein